MLHGAAASIFMSMVPTAYPCCCSACPSPLLDASSQDFSWALQACQLWELLQDAQLLCGHVNLQQVCGMVSKATTPPPAVLEHRQQVCIVRSFMRSGL